MSPLPPANVSLSKKSWKESRADDWSEPQPVWSSSFWRVPPSSSSLPRINPSRPIGGQVRSSLQDPSCSPLGMRGGTSTWRSTLLVKCDRRLWWWRWNGGSVGAWREYWSLHTSWLEWRGLQSLKSTGGGCRAWIGTFLIALFIFCVGKTAIDLWRRYSGDFEHESAHWSPLQPTGVTLQTTVQSTSYEPVKHVSSFPFLIFVIILTTKLSNQSLTKKVISTKKGSTPHPWRSIPYT